MMAGSLTKFLAAGFTTALLATGAQGGGAFSAEDAVSDQAMAEMRARNNGGAGNKLLCQGGKCMNNEQIIQDGKGGAGNMIKCQNSSECKDNTQIIGSNNTVVKDGGTKNGDVIEDGGIKNETGQNSVLIAGGTFKNKMTTRAFKNMRGIGTAIQNNGNKASISVSTTVTLNGGT